jgi:hypothetical protein
MWHHPNDGGDTLLWNVGSKLLHGVTFQKMEFFMSRSVSNITFPLTSSNSVRPAVLKTWCYGYRLARCGARWLSTFLGDTQRGSVHQSKIRIFFTVKMEPKDCAENMACIASHHRHRNPYHQRASVTLRLPFLLYILVCRFGIYCILPLSFHFIYAFLSRFVFCIAVCECLRSKTAPWLDNAGTDKKGDLKQKRSIGFGWFRKCNSYQFPMCELQSSIIQFTLPSLNTSVPLKPRFRHSYTSLFVSFGSTINLEPLSVADILNIGRWVIENDEPERISA